MSAKLVALILVKVRFCACISKSSNSCPTVTASLVFVSNITKEEFIYLAKEDKRRLRVHVHTRFPGSWLPLYSKVLSKTLC